MKIIALNGSPRKNWNTATLLQKVLDGANTQGAETELIHLYDLDYKGCKSCFVCKTKEGKSYGKCVVEDDLQPLLNKIEEADALFIGSPIYFGNVSGEMRSLMERLLFPYLVYSDGGSTLFSKKINVGLIYTMNATEDILRVVKYDELFKSYEDLFKMIFKGEVETLYSTDTYQFPDYSRVVADIFDVKVKEKRRENSFPMECDNAYNMGIRFAKINSISA
jgi:multimeric flavodoxin WrbA